MSLDAHEPAASFRALPFLYNVNQTASALHFSIALRTSSLPNTGSSILNISSTRSSPTVTYSAIVQNKPTRLFQIIRAGASTYNSGRYVDGPELVTVKLCIPLSIPLSPKLNDGDAPSRCLVLRYTLSNTSHAPSILPLIKSPACSHISATISSVLLTTYASGSCRRGSSTGQSVLMSGRKEFSCLASAGMVVRRRERRELRKLGDVLVR